MNSKGRIAAGDLRERITFQQRAAGQDSLGAPNGAWADVVTLSAKAEPLSGREYFAAGQMQASIDVRFTIRYRTGLSETMRVVWRGEPYEIVSPPINTDGARDVLEIMCTKGIRDGR